MFWFSGLAILAIGLIIGWVAGAITDTSIPEEHCPYNESKLKIHSYSAWSEPINGDKSIFQIRTCNHCNLTDARLIYKDFS